MCSSDLVVSGRGELHLSILIENLRREGFESATDLTKECNEFFSEHSVDAPHSASCDGITNYGGTINDAKNVVIAEVVVKGGDVDAAMDNYVKTTQNMVDEILGQLNAD